MPLIRCAANQRPEGEAQGKSDNQGIESKSVNSWKYIFAGVI